MTLLEKIHRITTYVAVFSGFLASIFLFMFFVDEILRLDIVSWEFEAVIALIAILGAILFAMTTAVSLLLSLYLISQKN